VKICYLCTDLGIPLHGHKGASAHVRGWLRAIGDAGHAATVVMVGTEDGEFHGHRTVAIPPPGLASSPALDVDRALRRALRHLWNNAGAERTLRELFARERPDLVYERYSPFAVSGTVVAREMGIPHLLEVNSPLAREGREHRNQALSDAAAGLELAAFRATSRIIAVSEALRDEIREAGVPEERITVVPNGVDTKQFCPEGQVRRVTDGAQDIVLGFVGSLKPWHGLEILAEAFRTLAARHASLHLLVVGDGPGRGPLEALRDELGDRVHLAGAVPQQEVGAYLRGIDVALAPYPPIQRFYFSPLKVLEYMAAGRAVVASAIGQVCQLVRHGESGLLVPPGDVQELVQAVSELAGNAPLRSRLGARARAVALAEHDWSARIRHILDIAHEAEVPRTGSAPRRASGGGR
jgi:glycosyltransferase involved in cell wall biosynthesis